MAYIYIVLCDDGSLYTGITNDMAKRMKSHSSGSGAGHAKYMRSHRPIEIAALWQTDEYKVAAKLEYAIKKRLSRQEKLRLIQNPQTVADFFPHLSQFEFSTVNNPKLSDFIGE